MAARKRTYTKRLRAEGEQETRQRIVDALVSLHEEIGPARTTVSAVAERAGVQRLTVYRHFPEEREMMQACSSRWAELHPLPGLSPDSAPSAAVTIRRVYEWYRKNERILTNVFRDGQTMPSVFESLQPLERALDELALAIDRTYKRRSADRQRTIRHVVTLSTWQSLRNLTAEDRKAAELAMRWIEACG